MRQRTLNLGIVAHVDAGKTTLTERLLYAAGVIDAPGSVDDGSTQTDSLALERRRGITIKSAVVSFALGDVTVNLIDTPGHPDFIAEVERVLRVLDGAVLVVSAVEGVQPQTPLLLRALQRLGVPTLVFVNKIDRRGADSARVLGELRDRLGLAAIPLGSVSGEGTPGAAYAPGVERDAALEALADRDDHLVAAYLDDEASVTPARLREALAAQTGRALVHPVLFGSALTGTGVEALAAALRELLPTSPGEASGRLSATVFKVERGPAGEKVAYVRVFSGSIRVRDRVRFGEGEEATVTAIAGFDGATAVRAAAVTAGQIGRLWGLAAVRIGDAIGEPPPRPTGTAFAPPTLESVVVPRRAADRHALSVALAHLDEQDPLIGVRRDDDAGELSLSLYGEVQKEVVEATLAEEYGLAVEFRQTTTIHVERPAGTGEAVEVLHGPSNPFLATIGLRVEAEAPGSGVSFALDVDARSLPLYVYGTAESFAAHMAEYVGRTLREGLYGWQVADCAVTMTRCVYSVPDGPPSRRGPLSTAADFRKLTPLVLMQALERAGTVVCEPVLDVRLELPLESAGAVMAALARLGADLGTPSPRDSRCTIDALLPAARVRELQRQLPGLTHGEGVLESSFAGYRPVAGEPPSRRRTTANPLDRKGYLRSLAQRVGP